MYFANKEPSEQSVALVTSQSVRNTNSLPAHRFHLRFLLLFPVDLSIKKSSIFFPPFIAATSQRGLAPRPAQVSPDGPQYFGGTFVPLNVLPLRRATLATSATTPSILANCCSMSARRLTRVSSTRFRRSMSASTLIGDRFRFAIVIFSPKNGVVCEALGSEARSAGRGCLREQSR